MPEGSSGLFCLQAVSTFHTWLKVEHTVFRNRQMCFHWTGWGKKCTKKWYKLYLGSSPLMSPFSFFCNCPSLSHHFIFSISFFLPSSVPLTGLQPFRPVTSSWCSSVASLAPSSGGYSQHRISYNLKRAVSQQRACREEFNNSRCVCT